MKTKGLSGVYSSAAVRVDSWINTVTGLGTLARDKVFAAYYSRSPRLSDAELDDLFNGDDLAAKIVSKVVDDALRSGFELTIGVDEEDAETVGTATADAEAMSDALDALGATKAVRHAWTWGRLFGGAAVFVVTDEGFDAPQDEPLDESRLRSVLALTVLDRREISPATYYDDPSDARFGDVRTYRVTPLHGRQHKSTVMIHESRLVLFGGAMTTKREREGNDGWDLSVLQRPYDVLRMFNTSFQALANILQDASQGIFKMDGLIDMIASGEKDAVQTRMALVDLQRSVARSLVIDAEKEDFTRLAPSLAGYPEAIESMMLRLAAAADMPVSCLFGRAPAGMNATGESDRLLWAQSVESEQRQVALPALERLATLVMLSADGPTGGTEPDSWSVGFPALVHMTDEQKAAIRKAVAETDAIYLAAGVLLPEEVALSRFRPGGYSTETTIETSDRETMLAEELEKLREPPPEPTPPPVMIAPPMAPTLPALPDDEPEDGDDEPGDDAAG